MVFLPCKLIIATFWAPCPMILVYRALGISGKLARGGRFNGHGCEEACETGYETRHIQHVIRYKTD